jgi:hypothetical protein
MAVKFGNLEFATAGDLIAGGGAFAVGFAVDSFLFSGGATSTETGGACAAGALAGKYAAQKVWRRLRKKKEAEWGPEPPGTLPPGHA